MKAVPVDFPNTSNIYQWVKGVDGAKEHPELLAIIEAARGLREKPGYFLVNGQFYGVSQRVWQQIKRGMYRT